MSPRVIVGPARRLDVRHRHRENLHARPQPSRAIPEYERALAFNRNWVEVLGSLAICKSYAGYLQELRQVFE